MTVDHLLLGAVLLFIGTAIASAIVYTAAWMRS